MIYRIYQIENGVQVESPAIEVRRKTTLRAKQIEDLVELAREIGQHEFNVWLFEHDAGHCVPILVMKWVL